MKEIKAKRFFTYPTALSAVCLMCIPVDLSAQLGTPRPIRSVVGATAELDLIQNSQFLTLRDVDETRDISQFGARSFEAQVADGDASTHTSLSISYESDGFQIDGQTTARSGTLPGTSTGAATQNGFVTTFALFEIPVETGASSDSIPFSVRWNFAIDFSEHRNDGTGTSAAQFSFFFGRSSTPGFNSVSSINVAPVTEPSAGSGYFEGTILPSRTGPIRMGRRSGLFDFRAGSSGAISNTTPNRFADINYSIDFLIGTGATSAAPILPTDPASDTIPTLTPDLATAPARVLPAAPSVFVDAPSGRWFDPVAADGFHYVIEDGSLFTEIIDFADGFDQPFRVFAEGQDLGLFEQDDSLDFAETLGRGVSSFTLLGISPLVDGEDPLAFPIQLGFSTDTATFAQFAVATIPEPASLAVLATGLFAGTSRRRRPI